MEKFVFEKNISNVLTGIYFLYNEHEIVYIGQSTNILKRVLHHSKNKDFDSWNSINCSYDKMNEAEATFILKHKPRYNLSVPKNEKYISKNILSSQYGVSKCNFNKHIKNGDIKTAIHFNSTVYVLVDELNNIGFKDLERIGNYGE